MQEINVLEDIITLLLLLPEKYEPEDKTQILDFYYKYNLLSDICLLIQNNLEKSVSEEVVHRFCYELSFCSISVKTRLICQIYKMCPEECRSSLYHYLMNNKAHLDMEFV